MEWLRRDEPHDDDALLTSIVRFDFLAAAVSVWDKQNSDVEHWFPSFAYFDSHRVDDVAERLIDDDDMKRLLPDSSLDDIADVIRALEAASRDATGAWNRWGGLRSYKVTEFLKAHPPRD